MSKYVNPTSEQLNMIMSFHNDVTSYEVRTESDVNEFWEFRFRNGDKVKVYAIEGSPQFEDTDDRVWEVNEEFADFLQELLDAAALYCPNNHPEDSCPCYEYSMYNRNGKLELHEVTLQMVLDSPQTIVLI